jgi:Methyltransferase domain
MNIETAGALAGISNSDLWPALLLSWRHRICRRAGPSPAWFHVTQMASGEEDVSVSAAGRVLSGGRSIETALRQLFKDAPKFHTAGDGLVDWGIQESFLWRLAALLTSSSLTLETGSGLSTVCLAIIGAEHICISPDEKEHHRIRRYCADHNISTERVRFVPLKSQSVLPSLDLRGQKLDFVLIDGSHAFPDPMIDYYFANRYLKVGGLLAVDDLNISSVGVLHKFLITEPAYELIEINGLKTGLYRRVGETRTGCFDQRFNATYPDFSYLALHTKLRERFRPMERKLRTALFGIPGVRRAYHWLKDWSQMKHQRSTNKEPRI